MANPDPKQWQDALATANEVRLARANLKKAIKAGHVRVSEILMGETPDWLETMHLEQLCGEISHFSSASFRDVCQKGQCGLTISVGSLTRRQRTVIGEALASWELKAEERAKSRRGRQQQEADQIRRGLGMAT